MSITITCEFGSTLEARQAENRLRRRGFTVSGPESRSARTREAALLVAHPYGAAGGNTMGNGLMGALPPLAGNAAITGRRAALVSVLTDDTRAEDCRRLMESMGGKPI